MTVPGVGTLMGPIEEVLREKFFPALFGGEEINADFLQNLGHSVKYSGFCIPDQRLSAESAYSGDSHLQVLPFDLKQHPQASICRLGLPSGYLT